MCMSHFQNPGSGPRNSSEGHMYFRLAKIGYFKHSQLGQLSIPTPTSPLHFLSGHVVSEELGQFWNWLQGVSVGNTLSLGLGGDVYGACSNSHVYLSYQ